LALAAAKSLHGSMHFDYIARARCLVQPVHIHCNKLHVVSEVPLL
jgi:hypothetical protein